LKSSVAIPEIVDGRCLSSKFCGTVRNRYLPKIAEIAFTIHVDTDQLRSPNIDRTMSEDTTDSWLKFLNPESLTQNLTRAAIFITCWEMLKEAVLEQPRDFFTHEWRDGEGIPSPTYKTDVLSLSRDPLIASALWFRDQHAITDDDIQLLRVLRTHRNDIAHELPKFLGSKEFDVQLDLLNGILQLVEKIDKWWIQNIEIPTNPDFDGRELTQEVLDGVTSMRMVFINLLVSVANGDPTHLQQIYEGFKKHIEEKRLKGKT
jgi:hypothetical protein